MVTTTKIRCLQCDLEMAASRHVTFSGRAA